MPPPRDRRSVDLAVAVALSLAAMWVYRASAGLPQMCDSCYSLAVTQTLLATGSVRLDRAVPADLAGRAKLPGYDPATDLPYHLVRRPGGTFYGYPLGSSVLSAPLVAYYTRVKGLSALAPDGTYSLTGDTALQLRAAAVVAGAAVGAFFLILRSFVPALWAAALAAGFALGSMCWSTLSRSLWSHTWAVLLLSLVVLCLVRLTRRATATARGDIVAGVVLGTLTFWLYLVRPHTALSAVAVGASLFAWHRRVLAVTTLTGAIWGVALGVVSWNEFGSLLPPSVYVAGTIDGRDMPARFAGLMLSPSRGLLVFCPYLAVLAASLVVCRRHLPDARLLLPAGLAVGAYIGVFSAYSGWHGGYCYGPRYFSDVLPWFVLAGGIAAGALLRAEPGGRRTAAGVLLAVCYGWAIFVHGRGAVSWSAWEWNYTCRTDADHIRLVTDWGHPQFLAGLTYGVRSDGTFVDP